MSLTIALLGYGKMGRLLDRLATERGHRVVLRIDREQRATLTGEQLRAADVAIDFSHPEAGFDNAKFCLQAGVPLVSGTTGWMDRFGEIERLCKERGGAFFYASNFSVGVNLFFALNRYLARLMNEQTAYRPTLTETHHTAKVDAPSGTAITLAEGILAELDRLNEWHRGSTEATDLLPVLSHRIDPTPGTHEVVYESEEDTLRIEHVAHGREGFARGALRAAEWLVGKRGVYGMSDLLDEVAG